MIWGPIYSTWLYTNAELADGGGGGGRGVRGVYSKKNNADLIMRLTDVTREMYGTISNMRLIMQKNLPSVKINV